MWLLSTDRAELRYFSFPEEVDGGYATLSHVWAKWPEPREQTFHEIQRLPSTSTQNPRDSATVRIQKFCILAKSHGYNWAWIDSCCINSSSSAECSEAVNSMYAWFAASETCYAYLGDVYDDGNPFEPDSDFSKSEWHERSWTLQELLAPKRVIFLSRSWKVLGTKSSLITPLAKRTRICRDILLGIKPIAAASVAERMSWAAGRKTTRTEDRAYSLMGIFGVNMPLMYGEGGGRAFLRLQKEVIAICPDQTIFAWGLIHPDFDEAQGSISRSFLEAPGNSAHISSHDRAEFRTRGLLAGSPDDFTHSAHLRPLHPDRYMQLFRQAVDYTYTFSGYGVSLVLPTSDFIRTQTGLAMHVAALACTDDSDEGSTIFLFLTQSPAALDRRDPLSHGWSFSDVGQLVQNHDGSTELQYYRGARWRCPKPSPLPSIRPTSTPPQRGPRVSALAHIHPREIRIAFSTRTLPKTAATTVMACCDKYRFEILPWVFDCLEHSGFVSSSPHCHEFVHTSEIFPLGGTGIMINGVQPTFHTLFTNFRHAETVGIIFSTHSRARAIVEGPDPAMFDDWFIRVFFTPSVLGDSDARSILAALEHSQLLPEDRDDLKLCRDGARHAHLVDMGKSGKPFIFPIKTAEETAPQRAIHVRAAASQTPLDDNEPYVIGHFAISMDLVGFENAHWQY